MPQPFIEVVVCCCGHALEATRLTIMLFEDCIPYFNVADNAGYNLVDHWTDDNFCGSSKKELSSHSEIKLVAITEMWDIGDRDAASFCEELLAVADKAGLGHQIAGVKVSHWGEAVMVVYLKRGASSKREIAKLMKHLLIVRSVQVKWSRVAFGPIIHML